ncbi:MAG TPA: hypothetical protein VHW74_13865 [Mycobacteriales bacterium]|nr:hypothetical protein [Mycobacteriales bacterium]
MAVVVVAVFAASLAGFEWHRAHRAMAQLSEARASDDARNAAGSVAAAEAVALFTYDYRDLAATQAKIASLATGSFAQRDASGNAAVQRQLLAAKAIGSAIVTDESISEPSADHAAALVVLTTKAASNGSAPTAATVYVNLDLQLVNNNWKVDEVQTLKPAS